MPTYDPNHEYYPDPVCYDFSKYGLSQGEIPEPTDAQIREFLRVVSKIETQVDLAGLTPAQVVEKVIEVSETKHAANAKKTDEAYAKLCSDTPSAEEIGKLPSAPRAGFFKYVTVNFLVPQLRENGSTTSSPNGVSSGLLSEGTSATP